MSMAKSFSPVRWYHGKYSEGYDLRPVRSARIAGRTLKFLALAIRVPLLKGLIGRVILWQLGVFRFRRHSPSGEAVMHPVHPNQRQLTKKESRISLQHFFQSAKDKHSPRTKLALQKKEQGKKSKSQKSSEMGKVEGVFDFHNAYLQGFTTPLQVAQRFLDVIRSMEESAVPLKPMMMWDAKDILHQAELSTKRFEQGKPFGILDGVPVAIKDELDLLPYKTMAGTRFYSQSAPHQDATAAARLRRAGALMVGKSSMHELGMGVTGMNTTCGTARNPHHLDHYPGGSSSGSAVAVASGICPLALGLDGGGSIRIPASLSGVVGLKTTWGRVSRSGTTPLSWSVSTVGPIGATVQDTAVGYAMIAGPDENDAWSMNQPEVHLKGVFDSNLEGIRLGWFPDWLHHSKPEVANAVKKTFDYLKEAGATIHEISIPGLDAAHLSLLISIVSEMRSSLHVFSERWNSPLCLENFINLRVAKLLRAEDYLRAQRIRAEAMKNFSQVFQNVDALITPSTACTAPEIAVDGQNAGESDMAKTNELMRFITPANLTGLPAISMPVGYDGRGLPIGLQFMGDAWQEALLLRLAYVLEQSIERKMPMLHYSLLQEQRPHDA